MRVAVVGGGWAGMAAAVSASRKGHSVTVFEAAASLGGRARAVDLHLPGGRTMRVDNGQHILIGAYTETLALMRAVGVLPQDALLRLPLTLRFPDGQGIAMPRLPAPLDALVGIARARGWSFSDKRRLLAIAIGWQRSGFTCAPDATVAQICKTMPRTVIEGLIDPLCVSALNTPARQASGEVFLRVLKDAMFGATGGSNLLLPRVDLGALFPEAAAAWLEARGAAVLAGRRVQRVAPVGEGWEVDDLPFDRVVIAAPSWEAARLVRTLPEQSATGSVLSPHDWAARAEALRFEAIATVYAQANTGLPHPMLALRSGTLAGTGAPAQFIFDRGQLGGPKGLLALVVSASREAREPLQEQVMAQAREQLAPLGITKIDALQTVVEKRATFACTPGLERPPVRISPGLVACGDYVEGPYPATLEGAVRSALEAAAAL